MADQLRWFKLWCTAPGDAGLLMLPPEHRWAWAVLGCYTTTYGTRGQVQITDRDPVLAAQMGLKPDALREVIGAFPNVCVSECVSAHISDAREEGKNRNGHFTVTWANWNKYQRDATAARRQKALRSKRRGEEIRGAKRRSTTPFGSSSGVTPASKIVPQSGAASSVEYRIPATVQQALSRAPVLGQVRQLREPTWWQAELRANPGIDPASELLKAEAWMASNARRAPKSNLPRFLHNWLARAERTEG